MNKWICCTSWCFWIPLILSWRARCIAVPDFAIHLWYYTTDILTFVICTISSSWDMIQRWSGTRLGRKYVNLDTLSPLQGVVDGHNRLSGDLQHNGATADRGLELASQLSASREQFFQLVESQHEEWMKGMAQKHKSFWDSMRSQREELMKGHKTFWDWENPSWQKRTGPSLLSSPGRIMHSRNCRTRILDCKWPDRLCRLYHRSAGITGKGPCEHSMISCWPNRRP